MNVNALAGQITAPLVVAVGVLIYFLDIAFSSLPWV
jgi:hypothetical protein